MRTVCLCALLSLVVSSSIAASSGARPEATARVIQIEVGDTMKFIPAAIQAGPGELIRVVIKHVGQMPKIAMGHNFVLLKKGIDPKGVAETCASSRETEFISPSVRHQMLVTTKLVGPGETADATFVTPIERGAYTFICTFPGHFALGMKGILTIK
jgi:azurin